ncbi:hypothetical protein OKA06_06000 [Novosphingobium sp. MW5]|nr:hypothetical protein [Novosphingobium sp. MW5]
MPGIMRKTSASELGRSDSIASALMLVTETEVFSCDLLPPDAVTTIMSASLTASSPAASCAKAGIAMTDAAASTATDAQVFSTDFFISSPLQNENRLRAASRALESHIQQSIAIHFAIDCYRMFRKDGIAPVWERQFGVAKSKSARFPGRKRLRR